MTEGLWLSITDYSNCKNISISTIRRYIKKGKLEVKKENGKYFIFLKDAADFKKFDYSEGDDALNDLRQENNRLQALVRSLQQELEEYKTLALTYEDRNRKKAENFDFSLN